MSHTQPTRKRRRRLCKSGRVPYGRFGYISRAQADRLRAEGKLPPAEFPNQSASLPLPATAVSGERTLPAPISAPNLGTIVPNSGNGPEKISDRFAGLKIKRLPEHSIVRKKALTIVALEFAGYSHEEIGKELGLSSRTVRLYKYLGGKHGWLDHFDPKDQLEYQLSHKVVRNLDAMLDSADPDVKKEVTLETAKGTIFKKFEQGIQQPQTNILAIRIEMPTSTSDDKIREGSMDGVPAYVEGTIVTMD